MFLLLSALPNANVARGLAHLPPTTARLFRAGASASMQDARGRGPSDGSTSAFRRNCSRFCRRPFKGASGLESYPGVWAARSERSLLFRRSRPATIKLGGHSPKSMLTFSLLAGVSAKWWQVIVVDGLDMVSMCRGGRVAQVCRWERMLLADYDPARPHSPPIRSSLTRTHARVHMPSACTDPSFSPQTNHVTSTLEFLAHLRHLFFLLRVYAGLQLCLKQKGKGCARANVEGTQGG